MLGLNSYPTAYTKFAAKWVHIHIKKSVATNPFGAADHGGDAPGLIVQVDW